MRKFLIAFSLCIALCLSGCSFYTPAKVPFSSGGAASLNLDDAVGQLASAGFVGIDTEAVPTDKEERAGKVYSVLIDGDSFYSKGDGFKPDAPVLVKYNELEQSAVPAEEPIAESTANSEPPDDVAVTREVALAVNQQFLNIRAQAEEAYNTYLSAGSDGTFGTELEAYNAANNLNSQLLSYYSELLGIECVRELKYFDDYRLAMYTYISEMIEVTNLSMQYFDDGKTSTLSDLQKAASLVQPLYIKCYLLQDNFLYEAGYSYDEIDEILGNLEEDSAD